MRRRIAAIGSCLVGLASLGCSMPREARYVYQDHESGVIAIDKNTPEQMDGAVQLMERHFPSGNYEIVRAVEVVEGDRTIFESRNVSAEFDPAISTALRAPIVGTGKLLRQTDTASSDKVKITECRIVYKKRDKHSPPAIAFAETPKYMPECYTDPMATIAMDATQLAKAGGAVKVDDTVSKASTQKPSPPSGPSPPKP